jgi:hypothetical protein
MHHICGEHDTWWQHQRRLSERCLAAVDWSTWTQEEKLAALSRVFIPRNRDVIMNLEEIEEILSKPDRIQLPSRAPATAPKRRRSTASDFGVIASYNGIAVKRTHGKRFLHLDAG